MFVYYNKKEVVDFIHQQKKLNLCVLDKPEVLESRLAMVLNGNKYQANIRKALRISLLF